MQAAHFGEELTTGFHTQFPQRFGLAPWPTSFFVVFNLAWLVIWCVAVALLRSGGRAAAFPIWFLAIAGLANGVVHPALAFSVGGYFPGLWTSPAIGIAGLLLLRWLVQTTAFDPNHRPAES
jgi:hypothetical protein